MYMSKDFQQLVEMRHVQLFIDYSSYTQSTGILFTQQCNVLSKVESNLSISI